MSRPNLRRTLAASTSAALVALTLLAAPVSAGNTRDGYIGDPGGTLDDVTGYGPLTYTPTSPGGYSIVHIEVRNDGGQTLNHAMLLGGEAADAAPNNLLFARPSGLSLAADLSYAAVFPTGACIWTARSLSCGLGQIPAGAPPIEISVVVKTSSWTTSSNTWYGLYLNEGNETGSNQDNFYATGTVTAASPDCGGLNQDANYFLAGSSVSLITDDCDYAGGQFASLQSGPNVSGQGGFGLLAIGDPIAPDCPTGYTCYGDAVEADVLGGDTVPGGLEWTVKWYGIKSLKGVIHLNDDGTYDVISFKKTDLCSAAKITNCWTATSSSNGSADPLWFQATFITPDNGRIGGFI